MNSDSSGRLREEMEARLTAYLVGELSGAEAAEVREALAADPELGRACERMRRAIEFVREAVGVGEAGVAAGAEAPRLSEPRRSALLEQLRAEPAACRKRRWTPSVPWDVGMAVAALLVLTCGLGVLLLRATARGPLGFGVYFAMEAPTAGREAHRIERAADGPWTPLSSDEPAPDMGKSAFYGRIAGDRSERLADVDEDGEGRERHRYYDRSSNEELARIAEDESLEVAEKLEVAKGATELALEVPAMPGMQPAGMTGSDAAGWGGYGGGAYGGGGGGMPGMGGVMPGVAGGMSGMAGGMGMGTGMPAITDMNGVAVRGEAGGSVAAGEEGAEYAGTSGRAAGSGRVARWMYGGAWESETESAAPSVPPTPAEPDSASLEGRLGHQATPEVAAREQAEVTRFGTVTDGRLSVGFETSALAPQTPPAGTTPMEVERMDEASSPEPQPGTALADDAFVRLYVPHAVAMDPATPRDRVNFAIPNDATTDFFVLDTGAAPGILLERRDAGEKADKAAALGESASGSVNSDGVGLDHYDAGLVEGLNEARGYAFVDGKAKYDMAPAPAAVEDPQAGAEPHAWRRKDAESPAEENKPVDALGLPALDDVPVVGARIAPMQQVSSVEEDLAVRAPVAAPEPQPETRVEDNPFSTFSMNVTDVSFKLAAASFEQGVMPDAATVRSEEFINAFDYRDPEPRRGAPIAFAWERARHPFAHNRDLLRLAIKTAAVGRAPGRPLRLVLLLDNSGSMERADRVATIRECLRVLAGQLSPQDRLSVVAFARTARLWVDGLEGGRVDELLARVGDLTPQGGTNLEEALTVAYETALRQYVPEGVNRVVLLTDGAANLGDADPESLRAKVEAHRRQGIALDCFGIGWEGYNDDLLEVLSRNGDGRYGFVNSPGEAAEGFAAQLAGALRVAASDVKVQVEFNPRRAAAYRQIGYAKHQLTKEQFRDNTVDAAEIGAAESGNALYVVELLARGDGPIGTVRVRYKVPGTARYEEHEWTVPYLGGAPELGAASPALRLAAAAAVFSEWIVSSPYAVGVTPDALLSLLHGVAAAFGADPRPALLERMIRQAISIVGQ